MAIEKTNSRKNIARPGSGRRPSYTPEIATEICTRLAQGEPLRKICKDDHMPCEHTVYYWLLRPSDFQKEFEGLYNQARMCQAEAFFDDMMEVARDTTDDSKVKTARDRLIIDTMKFAMAKIFPKKYGDRIAVDHAGGLTLSLTEALDAAEGTGKPKVKDID